MKKMAYVFLWALFLLAFRQMQAQERIEPSEVDWYTVEQADSLHAIQPRPWLIDVYTEWCGWCKHMMKTTFASKGIAQYINNNFYAVKFDAESFEPVTYDGKEYKNDSIGRQPKHDLAKMMLQNRMSFPTIVYRDRNKKLYPVPGYKDVRGIEPILVYFSEAMHNFVGFPDFERSYQHAFATNYAKAFETMPDSMKLDTLGTVKWYDFETASDLAQKTPRKLFIFMDTPWCISCKVMKNSTFRDSKVATMLNKHFYPVSFNAASQDTMVVFGKKYAPGKQGNPHQLAMALTGGQLRMPVTMYMDGEKSIRLNEYVMPEIQYLILDYFNKGLYLQNVPLAKFIQENKPTK